MNHARTDDQQECEAHGWYSRQRHGEECPECAGLEAAARHNADDFHDLAAAIS